MFYTTTLEKEGPDAHSVRLPQQAVARRTLPRCGQGRIPDNALRTREMFVTYFNDTGAVPWQNDYALPENIVANSNN